jgi:o-succinylbenzoate synthase
MKIEAIVVREIHLRLKSPFETSFGTVENRRILLVEVVADGASGWGEVTAGETPGYNAETTDTAWHILRDFIGPCLAGKTLARASDFPELVADIRGQEMAKSGVENALWDAEAKLAGVPLWRLLGGVKQHIDSGVSLGIRENPEALVAKVAEELSRGYQRIKLKIKPGKDYEFVRAVRQEFPRILLSVDANSAYRPEDTGHLAKFDQFNLLMMEQPLYWDDIYAHAKLQAQIKSPICLDECIHNTRHALAAIELNACRIINIKVGRVGGHSEARLLQETCRERGVPVWCGGMLESGIGRAHNVAMSTLPGFSLPGDVSASSRYWDEDIIDPQVEVSAKGTIEVPIAPGIGYQVRRGRIEALTVRSQTFSAKSQASVLAL